ncbi:protein of unknown function [Asanoa hainanensis]|uniref:DUF4259 domain-containing protein n=1 Tax=Asanoa hainanensis TaxID=560556 RepID=A0A239MSJ6_9ACTN|nr:DUF4259 domain-containing protein [Asanoa hainanensis]SNT45797.1 protein of unknown function [Asanoa hainanensis]
MATWNVGPFDNDEAVEWCDNLRRLAPNERSEFVERTLADAVRRPTELSDRGASEVVAAAATVLQLLTGIADPTTPYAPVFLACTGDITPTPHLRELARAALRVVMADQSAFRARWADDVEEDSALETLDRIHRALAGD